MAFLFPIVGTIIGVSNGARLNGRVGGLIGFLAGVGAGYLLFLFLIFLVAGLMKWITRNDPKPKISADDSPASH
jgi:hypothetical protein